MSAIFDTLEYTQGAIKIGIPREQAEFQAEQLGKLTNNKLVTKDYFHNELIQLEQRIIIKLGAIMVVCCTLLGLIIKL